MYPVTLDITGKLCVIVGGGRVACRKAEGVLAAGAVVRVVSPELGERLSKLVETGAVQWLNRRYESGDLQGAYLVFAATDLPEVQRAVLLEARSRDQLINVVDMPEECGFQVPASVRRGDLLLTVSTHGKSPAVAAMIRKKLELEFGWEYQHLLELISALRSRIVTGQESLSKKKLLFENVLGEDIVTWIRTGRLDLLEKHLQSTLGETEIPEMKVMRVTEK